MISSRLGFSFRMMLAAPIVFLPYLFVARIVVQQRRRGIRACSYVEGSPLPRSGVSPSWTGQGRRPASRRRGDGTRDSTVVG